MDKGNSENKQQQPVLGPDIGYVDILNHLTEERIKKERAEGTDVSKTPLRPSAAGQCTRELAYALMEYHGLANYEKELITPEQDRIFKMGYAVEEHIIREMRQAFKDLFQIKYTQQSLSFAHLKAVNNPGLSQFLEGSTDLILWSEQHRCIADIKSKKVKYSSYRNDDWIEFSDKMRRMKTVKKLTDLTFWVEDLEAFLKELDSPFFAANFLQLNLYALNPFIVERGIDHAAIIQYDKNSSRLREVRFKPSQKLYDYVIFKMQAALDAVDHNEPERAEKEFKLGSIKCAFCNFKKQCWSESDPLKAFFKSMPSKDWPKDTSRLGDVGNVLEDLYVEYKEAASVSESLYKKEDEILSIMLDEKISKVRFLDGEVYEVKYLKSPKEHYELRRSKV